MSEPQEVGGWPTIVVCADSGYRIPLAVVVASLAANHVTSPLRIVALHTGFSDDDRATIAGLAGAHAVEWVEPDRTQLAGARLPSHLPEAALFRLMAPALLEGSVERFVYLDTDVVVTGDLGDLFATDLDGHPVAAVRDAWIEVAGAPNGPPYAALGLDASAPYFNSGVMVVDGAAWRDEDLIGRCLDLLRAHRLPYADQCALNAVLADRWHRLPARWNLQTAHGTTATHLTDPSELISVLAAVDDPAVVHYTGRKPWQHTGVRRAEIWEAMVAATPFAAEAASARTGRDEGGGEPRPSGLGGLRRSPAVRRAGSFVAGRAKRVARRGGVEVRRVGAPARAPKVDPGIVDLVLAHTERIVGRGPFTGMLLAGEESWGGAGDLVPKLLGTYEQELAAVVDEVVAWAPDRIVNLGCADGYYAIGLARRVPGAEVIGVDIVVESLRIAREAARANGVDERTTFLEHMDDVPEVDGSVRTAWFVDIEGAEEALADGPWVERARQDILVVECHDFSRPGVTALLCRAFDASHTVEVIDQQGRDPNAIALLRDVPEPDRWIALSEGRPRPMHWLVLRPRYRRPS
jgi:lipopolysaccharide biosynthesis glycosyltransferase